MNERWSRGLLIDRDVERLKQQLIRFQPFLSRKATSASLEDFDRVTQRLIGRIFGSSSDFVEAYEYAKIGEAGSLVNMPEEAQEHGARDTYRESLQQRRQVLESCLSKLTVLRSSRVQPTGIAGVRVADYMSHDVRSVHKDATLQEAARLLSKWKVGSLLVDDDRRYIGIITDTDLSRKGTAKGLDPSTSTVKTCMSKPVISIEDDEPLASAIALMKQKSIRHLAVTEDGTIIGVLSVSDLLRAYSELAGLDVERAEEE
ncbi:MAG: CBS domain-containing protein [Nitrospira sp.]|nr:CBS domain-containing protein [Nitrospira sp.]